MTLQKLTKIDVTWRHMRAREGWIEVFIGKKLMLPRRRRHMRAREK